MNIATATIHGMNRVSVADKGFMTVRIRPYEIRGKSFLARKCNPKVEDSMIKGFSSSVPLLVDAQDAEVGHELCIVGSPPCAGEISPDSVT
jgi:hypothetical protein